MLARLLRCTRGVTAVEFALVAPLLALIVMGLFEFGLAVNEKMKVVTAARAGAQYGYKSPDDTAAITQAAKDASGLAALSVAVATSCGCGDGSTVACNGTCADGSALRNYVTVTATKTHALMFEFPGIAGPLTLTGTTTIRSQ